MAFSLPNAHDSLTRSTILKFASTVETKKSRLSDKQVVPITQERASRLINDR